MSSLDYIRRFRYIFLPPDRRLRNTILIMHGKISYIYWERLGNYVILYICLAHESPKATVNIKIRDRARNRNFRSKTIIFYALRDKRAGEVQNPIARFLFETTVVRCVSIKK